MRKKKEKSKRLIIVSRLLFVLYMRCVLYFLLVSEGFGRTNGGVYRYNLEPLAEIKRFYNMLGGTRTYKAVLNLFGNIACFMPFGLFVPYIFKRRISFIKVVFTTFMFSLCIEVIQLYFMIGIFDVDDLILNTIGGALGYVVYAVLNKIRNED